MKLIVGLGNPGVQYRNTRHNIGFRVVDKLAESLGVTVAKEKFRGLIAETRMEQEKVMFLKPMTFMNISGESVALAARNHIESPTDVLVITDDLDLPLGKLRIRHQGSAGGHNGLKSIIASLGTSEFPRIRVGVGRPDGSDVVDYVLGTFLPDEWPVIDEAVAKAAEAVAVYIRHGINQAMNQYNK